MLADDNMFESSADSGDAEAINTYLRELNGWLVTSSETTPDIATSVEVATTAFYQYDGHTIIDGSLAINTGIICDEIGVTGAEAVDGVITVDPTSARSMTDGNGYAAAPDNNNILSDTFNCAGGRFNLAIPQYCHEPVANYARGKTIDRQGLAPSTASVGGSGLVVNNVLNEATVDLTSNLRSAYSGGTLDVVSDGGGGSVITVTPPKGNATVSGAAGADRVALIGFDHKVF